ncbi:MAG: mannose/fructose-specific phosphotransferase system component IIA [Candidatus Krumholzibacteriia bacterium]|jgi:mannose/fructose-specific phosphotransferase system component IIA
MIRALVITHGDISTQLVNVVEMIMGPTEGLSAQTNVNKSATELQNDVKAWLAEGEEGAGEIILIDDYGGSCASAAVIACGEMKNRTIIAGVNLAMLLGYVTWRDSEDHPELVAKIINKGREAIMLVGGR